MIKLLVSIPKMKKKIVYTHHIINSTFLAYIHLYVNSPSLKQKYAIMAAFTFCIYFLLGLIEKTYEEDAIILY